MAVFKSINQNHDNLPDEIFWTKDKWGNRDDKSHNNWIRLTRNLQIRYIERISNQEELQILLDNKIIGQKKLYHLTIVKNNELDISDWHTLIINQFEENSKAKKFDFNSWQYFLIEGSDELINPFTEKISIFRRMKRTEKSQIQRKHKKLNSQVFLLNNNLKLKDQSVLLEQAKIKNVKKFNRWQERLEKRGHSTQNILEMSGVKVHRNHYTVNSNFNKSGKIIVTDENLILIRRKFNLFGLSFGSLLPLVVFARPANKLIIAARIFMEFLKIPLQLVKGLRPALSTALPAIGGLFVSLSFFNFNKISNYFNDLLPSVAVNPVSKSIDFFVENPTAVPAVLGMLTGIRFLIQRLILRGEEIVILPHNLCTQLLQNGNQLIGRWKVKGSDLLKARSGVQYRFGIRNYDLQDNRFGSEIVAQNIFNIIFDNIPETIELRSIHSEDSEINDTE